MIRTSSLIYIINHYKVGSEQESRVPQEERPSLDDLAYTFLSLLTRYSRFRSNSRIQIFDQDGRFLDEWTQFGSPSGIWIDKHDTLYVAVPGRDGGITIGSAKTGSLTAVIHDTSPEVAIADTEGNVYSGLVGGQQLQQFVKQ